MKKALPRSVEETALHAHANAATGATRRFLDWALSTEPRRRMRVSNTAGALMLLFISMSVLAYLSHAGLAPPMPVSVLAIASIGGLMLILAAIRSGWTERFQDPGLTFFQVLYGVCCCAISYALAGPARGAVFPVLMVIAMAGVFGLELRQLRRVAFFAVALFGVVMVLAVRLDPQNFAVEVELAHFAVIAAALPMTVSIAARLARMRESARRDGLTGLLTRQYMRESIEIERQRCVRSGAPFSVALIDLDHFKRVNDAYGHAAGDEVLRTFAREALQTMRISDVLARWGGEEFLLMMPDTALEAGVHAVDRLRMRIASEPFAVRPGTALGVTLSAGVAEHPAGGDLDRTIERADAALYESKRSGRNRVTGG